ncbi:MAG TPA: GRP family sugar transporter [bacterium]|nr:GRP family sugar transporter [bacterium]HPR88477.1 GRP family sugar transporter [bacterium]
MVIVQSYALAVFMCVITMLCWGSWANTQKLASKEWRFQLFYWDYSIGVLLISLVLALTMGSMGNGGRHFLPDLQQATGSAIWSALLGGIVFNFSNILLSAAIDIAGMAVAFPVGVGLALVIGVITNYLATPVGNASVLFTGVGGVVLAIIVSAIIYGRLPASGNKSVTKGLLLSILAGVAMGFFYRFVAASMAADYVTPEAGKMTPYTAMVIFAVGLFISNFVWNSIVMAKPFSGAPVTYKDYFTQGNSRLHLVGLLGGAIWGVGMCFNIIAAGAAGFAISYGLGQGATMVASLWGVFIWKEFKNAPAGTNKYIALMFLFFFLGLGLIIAARLA